MKTQRSLPRLGFKSLAYAAVPLASFLTFMVQPLMGKFLLPWHGGSPSTWVSSMVFFQFALFSGYLLAYLLQRWSLKSQCLAIGGLALLVPWITWLPPLQVAPESAFGVLASLFLSLFPAMLLTTSIGIVLHGWFRQIGENVPYYLYSLSNLGSLLALVSYPFLIEPRIDILSQSVVVRLLLLFLALLCVGIVGLLIRNSRDQQSPSVSYDGNQREEELISGTRKLYWLLLSAAACMAMIGVTRLIAAEIGSNPLSWIASLSLYLLSFSITFSGRWKSWMGTTMTVALALCLVLLIVWKGLTVSAVGLSTILVSLGALASATLLAHGLIYQTRPRFNFAQFYLVIAMGGILGGFFASISAPNVFSLPWEFYGSLVLILGFGTWSLSGSNSWISGRAWGTVTVAVLPVFVLLFTQAFSQVSTHSRIRHLRNIHGQTSILISPGVIECFSETTLHGMMFREGPRENLPTTYYHHGSGLGRFLHFLQDEREALNIGVVGLGVGTLAAYNRERDRMIFWDINPISLMIAESPFTYIAKSKGEVSAEVRDGRIAIRESGESFDLLVIDAFSGDSIPFHLITRESIQEALLRLENGILAIHISNRYMDLFPVLATHAAALGVSGLKIVANPSAAIQSREGATASVYYFFFPHSQQAVKGRFMEHLESESDRVEYQIVDAVSLEPSKHVHWTDKQHAILDVLKLRR